MNTPESIVTSLDWSEKLKDAGFPQATQMWWAYDPNHEFVDGFSVYLSRPERLSEIAAPTAEEILRRLPDELSGHVLCTCRSGKTWAIGYATDDPEWMEDAYFDTVDTLANAAAAMYCYLAEQKLLPK